MTMPHQRCLELLPWLINGSLDPTEARAVEDHLADCPSCRAEYEDCQGLAERVAAEASGAPVVHPARLDRLLARLGADETELPPYRRRRPRREAIRTAFRRTPISVRWLLAGQLAALVLALVALGIGRPAPSPPAEFRTLATTSQSGSGEGRYVRVVFAPETSEAELRSLLVGLRAELVGGPSPGGVYTLALPAAPHDGPQDAELGLLRAHPRVRFAEAGAAIDARHD